MLKLLHFFIIFIFVVIILNAPENGVLINTLNRLISKKETMERKNALNGNKYDKNGNYLIKDTFQNKTLLNLDELNKSLFKTNRDLAAIHTQILEGFQCSSRRYDNYLHEANFSKIPKALFNSFFLSENFLSQERLYKPLVKLTHNKQSSTIQEVVSKTQKKNILFENLDLNDLIASNESINKRNLLRDDNDRTFEIEDFFLKKSFFNLNIEKDLNHNLDIKEIKTNSDKIINRPIIQNLYDSKISEINLENFVKLKNPKEIFDQPRSLEKLLVQEKIIKNEACFLQEEKIIDKEEIDPKTIKNNIMIENLHLKDLIANNSIINKTKALKANGCENDKKEKVLSYVDSLLKKPPLVLNDLVDKVLKNNPDLAATKRRIEANALVVPRVQVLDDPLLTVMRHDSPLQSNSPFFTKMRYEASQLLPFPGKLRLKGQIAQQMLEFAQNEEETTMRELVLQTKRLYYQLYLNYAALRINKQNQEIITRFIEDTLALYKTGEEKYNEVLKAQVELQLLKKELLNLLSDHDFIVSMINAILDYPQKNEIGKPIGFFTDEINYKYELLEQIAVNNRSELKGIKALVSKECFKAKLAKRNYFPDFKVMGRYEDRLGSNQTSWGVGVTVNVPIWIPQKQRREMKEAMKNANAFQKDLESFEAKIRGNVRDLLSKIESTEEKIDLYETGLVPKTSEALLSGEAVYKSGKGDFLVLLDTIRQFQDFELEYEAERAQREILLAELERTLGVPLEDLTCFISN